MPKNEIIQKKSVLHLPILTEGKVGYIFNQTTGKYQYMSTAINNLTGYSIDELNTKGFKSIVYDSKDRYEFTQNNIKGLIEEFYAIYKIETKKGELKLIEDNAFNHFNEKGERIYSTGVLKDITSFQNNINKLKDDKNKLDAILKLAEVIFIIADSNGKINLINNKGCEVFNCKFEENAGYKWNKLTSVLKEESVASFGNIFNPDYDDADGVETIVMHPEGEEQVLSWHRTILRDDEGNPVMIVASGRDVTGKKKEENIQKVISRILQAANSERNLGELFKFIHNAIAGLMLVENFYIALYDKENELLTFPYFIDKYDTEDPPKKPGKGLTEYVLRKGESVLVDKKLDEELVAKGEIELLGTQSPIWLGIPLKIKDKTIGVMVVQDYENESTYTEKHKEILEVISYPISMAIERKRVEQEREELIARLSKLNVSKDKLFSLISHDLRGPFNSLLGFSEILTTEYDSLTDEEIKEYLGAIYEASKNLFGMTNNLLQFSRFQTGQIEFKPEQINIGKFVDKSLKLLKGNALKKQVNIITKIAPGSFIIGDEDMIYSVIQNLISNAIKFTDKGGDVIISCSKLSPSGSGTTEIEFKVEDTGIGINEQDMKKILNGDMFSNPGTEREYGTGLGLVLIKEFVEKNGGMLSIESKPHQGSRFICYFPAED
jgi:PAS domain S-box-containing protein